MDEINNLRTRTLGTRSVASNFLYRFNVVCELWLGAGSRRPGHRLSCCFSLADARMKSTLAAFQDVVKQSRHEQQHKSIPTCFDRPHFGILLNLSQHRQRLHKVDKNIRASVSLSPFCNFVLSFLSVTPFCPSCHRYAIIARHSTWSLSSRRQPVLRPGDTCGESFSPRTSCYGWSHARWQEFCAPGEGRSQVGHQDTQAGELGRQGQKEEQASKHLSVEVDSDPAHLCMFVSLASKHDPDFNLDQRSRRNP